MSNSFSWKQVRSKLMEESSDDPLRSLSKRYLEVESVVGRGPWMGLTMRLAKLSELSESRAEQVSSNALDDFLESVTAARVAKPPKRLFISHRQKDVKLAERLTCIAKEHGYAYWLDVHDPTLQALTGSTIATRMPPPVLAVLIAAVIEMALLNCTHVIALRSVNAKGSDWIPYEFGRVKTRSLWSIQASTWVGQGVTPPEYAYLAPIFARESEIRVWLGGTRKSQLCSTLTHSDSLDLYDGSAAQDAGDER